MVAVALAVVFAGQMMSVSTISEGQLVAPTALAAVFDASWTTPGALIVPVRWVAPVASQTV